MTDEDDRPTIGDIAQDEDLRKKIFDKPLKDLADAIDDAGERARASSWTSERRLSKALWALGRMAAHYRLLSRSTGKEALERVQRELVGALRQADEWKALMEKAKYNEAVLRDTRTTEVEYLELKKKLSQAIKDLLSLAKDHEALRSLVAAQGRHDFDG